MEKVTHMRKSEAKILMFLSVAKSPLHYTTAIAAKLSMDYSYCLHILASMHLKGWIIKDQRNNKRYYFNTDKAPLDKAKEIMMNQ